MIRAIAAIDDQRGIAKAGHIPWEIPEDTAYYKQMTLGSVVVMGKATYEGFAAPLPERRNIVLSHSLTSVREGFELINNFATFLQKTTGDIWIIGGRGPYESLLPYCDELYLTHVRGDFKCDRFFPAYESQYELVSESPKREQNGYEFTYNVYRKTGEA